MRYSQHMKTAALPDRVAEQADEIRATVAANLNTLLEERRWSRRAAAMALGLSHRYVNSRAIGEVELSSSDLVLFANFLEVPITAFFADTKKAPTPKGEGQELPEMDSNHQPAVSSLDAHRRAKHGLDEPSRDFPRLPGVVIPMRFHA